MLTMIHEEPVFPIVLLSLLFDESIDRWWDGWDGWMDAKGKKKRKPFRLVPIPLWDSHFTGRLRGHHMWKNPAKNAWNVIDRSRVMGRCQPLYCR